MVSFTKLLNCSEVKVVVVEIPVPVLKLRPVESVAIPSLMINETDGLLEGPLDTVKEFVLLSYVTRDCSAGWSKELLYPATFPVSDWRVWITNRQGSLQP